MLEAEYKALEARWRELYDQYEAIRASIPPVVRTEWTYRARYHPDPLHFLRQPPRGRVMRRIPVTNDEKAARCEYGFDRDGRVIFERVYGYKEPPVETFYGYNPGALEILTFTPIQKHYRLSFIAHFAMPAGRIERQASLKIVYSYLDTSPAAGQIVLATGKMIEDADAAEIWSLLLTENYALSWTHETYHYSGRYLERIRGIWHRGQQPFRDVTDQFRYDHRHRLERIVRTFDRGQPWTMYRRRKKGETLASITTAAKQKLVEAIPKMIAAAGWTEPLYCLNLLEGGFPPTFYPGFELDRQRKMEPKPADPNGILRYHVEADLWWYLWDVDEDDDNETHRHVLHEEPVITDAETLEACENLATEFYMHRHFASELTTETTYEICRELNLLDWSKITPVTPDFIVYACDTTEHVEPAESLRLSGASEAQIADWRSRGMLDKERNWDFLLKPR